MLFRFILLINWFVLIHAHGYLFDPIARSSAWLVDDEFKQCCSYPGHMEMFCGGVGHQWNSNGGKCGICGEPYDRAVKMFEKGGRLYLGKIVKTYNEGQQIEVQVKLSANHQGYFEFRLCNLDPNPDIDATQECLDEHLLTVVDTNSTKFRDVKQFGSEMIHVRLQLPMNFHCKHCVFQWKYTTGNNWGRDPVTNQAGPGLGRENETFMGCSDISIIANPKTRKTTRKMFALLCYLFPALDQCRYRSNLTRTTPTTKSSSVQTTTSTTRTTTRTTIYTTARRVATPKSIPSSFFLPTRLAPAKVPKSWSGLLVAYKKGDDVIYNGIAYRCVTSHQSYAGAEPSPLTWALWRRLE